jgi:predicted  nucleic acid-binding Zn-ribbon protein
MSPRARTTAPKRSGSSTRRTSTAKRGKGQSALDRLTKSVDAAQDALKDLRGEMGRGSSGVLKDLDKQLKDARKNLRGASKSVIKELEELQQKVTPGAKKSTSRSSGGAKRSTARKSTARSSASRASSSRSSSSRASTARKSSGSRSTSGARRSSASRAKKS